MQTWSRLLLLAGLSAAALAAAPAENLRLLQVEPTVLFAAREPLSQIAWVTVENAGAEPVAAELRVTVGMQTGPTQTVTLPPGVSQQNALVPDLTAPGEATFTLRSAGTVRATLGRPWQPQRKWKIFVVKSAHEDIGYENFLWLKQKEIADFVDLGAHLSRNRPTPAEEGARTPGGYHYWMETLLFPRYYEAERGTSALRELLRREVKPGGMGLGAAPSGIHAHWMDYEELVRAGYPGRREYRDRFGLDLDTFAIVDNPSMSWSSAQMLAGAGYKYAVRFGQPFRTGGNNDYRTTKLPPVFWWEAPDGASRILYTWRNHYGINFWFGQITGGFVDLTDLGAANVQREIMAVQSGEKLGPYPYDAALIPSYQDHDIPAWDNRALRRWTETYRYPEISISDPRDFLVYMEKTYSDELPVLRGDLNNFSADYATIDPHSQGQKRTAARLLPLAEGLGALAGATNPAFAFPTREAELTYRRMHDFTEHSWPTSPPARDVHQFNSQWGKILEGGRALAESERLYEHAFGAFAAQIPTGDTRTLVVFNSLAHARTDLVILPADVAAVQDDAGQPVPIERLADGSRVMLAREIPAFGYRTYRLPQPADAAARAAGSLRAEGAVLENEFYRVTFDADSGAVRSIMDRELQQELVDPQAPYQFNQIVWVEKRARESKEGTNYAPRRGAKLTPRVGPLAAEMESSFTDVKLGGAHVTQTVRLYAGVKRIDVSNDLRHIGVLHSTRSADRYKSNLFFAFPVKVDGFTARAEQAGGVVRPYDDQLRWGSHDYLAANRWVDVSNAQYGVTMVPHQSPVVHFGAIRYNELSIDYRTTSSHLYSFAWSNRMAGLFTLCADDMNNRFEYSFSSHAGDWNAGATTRFGWAVASPLRARVLPAGQVGPLPRDTAGFLAVDAPNVQVTVFKDASAPGRGWIVRLVETEGKATTAALEARRLPFDAAWDCDLVENDRQPLAVSDGRVTVPLRGFAMATVRLTRRTPFAATVAGVTVEAAADSRLHLRWPTAPGAIGYNVFRSADPDEPVSAYSHAGRAGGNSFTDTKLDLDTTYFYHVAAVGAGNQQGPASARVEGRTLSRNQTAPRPVSDLGVVRQSKERLMVCWNKSTDPDIARFLVYRGDEPGFSPAGREPVAVVKPGGYYLENFVDTKLAAGRTYYYQVLPEDWAGNRQTASPVAAGTTPADSP